MAPSVEPGAATRFLEVSGMVTPEVLQVTPVLASAAFGLCM